MFNASICLLLLIFLPRHVVDDSWTGSERQVTRYYVINGSKYNKTLYMYVYFPHAVTDVALCVGQSLCDPGHSSLVSFQPDTELFQATL